MRVVAVFTKYETWKIKNKYPPVESEKMVGEWLQYLSANKDSLFSELLRVKYYAQCTKDGDPTGVYALIQEFGSKPDYFNHKEKLELCAVSDGRECSSFIDYIRLDPHSRAIPGTIERVFLLHEKSDIWFDYTSSKLETEKKNGVSLRRFLEYETWRVDPAASQEGYENMIETWFKYVAENKEQLFKEWVSAGYYAQSNANGVKNGVYVMLFEYDCIEGHHAYKSRKLYSYAMNDGIYATYAKNDPYQFFDPASVNIDCMQPLLPELWI